MQQVYFLLLLLFLAGADFDFLAGDCEEVLVDFLVALFIGLILPLSGVAVTATAEIS